MGGGLRKCSTRSSWRVGFCMRIRRVGHECDVAGVTIMGEVEGS